MAFVQCSFKSEVLGFQTALTALLPEPGQRSAPFGRLPVLYLLHGLSDDHTMWTRRTSLERYVANRELAVIMPQVHRSFYTDMVHGPNYFTFLSEELPAMAESLFGVSTKPAERFVAGLSMGGYGAFKWALRQPERFAAAASLSGALNIRYILERWPADAQLIFGDGQKLAHGEEELFALAQRQASNPALPALYQCCGTEDFLYEDNVLFRDHLRTLGYTFTYEEEPGVHDWAYWDLKIQRVLDWLPLP